MKAVIKFKDGTEINTTAEKVNGSWIVGGDFLKATTDLGGKVFIYKGDKIYLLKGAAMIFQDYNGDN